MVVRMIGSRILRGCTTRCGEPWIAPGKGKCEAVYTWPLSTSQHPSQTPNVYLFHLYPNYTHHNTLTIGLLLSPPTHIHWQNTSPIIITVASSSFSHWGTRKKLHKYKIKSLDTSWHIWNYCIAVRPDASSITEEHSILLQLVQQLWTLSPCFSCPLLYNIPHKPSNGIDKLL